MQKTLLTLVAVLVVGGVGVGAFMAGKANGKIVLDPRVCVEWERDARQAATNNAARFKAETPQGRTDFWFDNFNANDEWYTVLPQSAPSPRPAGC